MQTRRLPQLLTHYPSVRPPYICPLNRYRDSQRVVKCFDEDVAYVLLLLVR